MGLFHKVERSRATAYVRISAGDEEGKTRVLMYRTPSREFAGARLGGDFGP